MFKYFAAAALGFFNLFNCQMENNFCNALLANDRSGLQITVDEFLSKLNPESDQEKNFQSIKNWITGHDCVVSVTYGSELLETEPPIKEFTIYIKGSANPVYIGILLRPDRWKFNRK